MEAAGWEKATTMPMWGVPFGETVKKYTEEQKEIFREYEKVVLADAQKMFRAAPLHRWLEARGAGPVTVFYWLCALGVCGLALALAFVR